MGLTADELEKLSEMLRPGIARLLGEQLDATVIRVSTEPLQPGDPSGAERMRISVQVRGQPISAEQERDVLEFLEMMATRGVFTR
jgi:hypothetical protein